MVFSSYISAPNFIYAQLYNAFIFQILTPYTGLKLLFS